MALVHPGLGEKLEALVNDVRAKEAEAGGNPPEVAALKAVLTYSILAMISLVSRDDGSSALDWEKADRTADEEWAKGRTVAALGQTLALMGRAPVRTWPEVEELAETLGLLVGDEDWDWTPEIVRLGGDTGLTVERQRTVDGVASFTTPEGVVTCEVYKARAPEVSLDGVSVYLVQMIGENQQLLKRYALMVDDPYWGRRIQPGEFAPGPLEETFVMGWRVKGRVRHDGEPAPGANVSLEGCCEVEGLGQARFWDSLEYNELTWSDTLETYVEGARVYAPIMTDEEGRWSFICPKGYGAMYQREGDGVAPESGETAPRTLKKLWAVYQGRKAELAEETEAIIDVLSGKLRVEGEPGCWVRVGTLDDPGAAYLVQEDGTALLEGLPTGQHNVVQFRLNGWGGWDSSVGCARRSVEVSEGATATVSMGSMEAPPEGKIAGRVYERFGVPAAGLSIVAVNFETAEVGDAIATTDGGGYWEAGMPEEGFGGDPWVMSDRWGSVPVLGYPYSDVVLGARGYAGWQEIWKPEAWRKGDRGHANFQYVPGGVWMQGEDGETYETEEAAYGGWVTTETLPRFRHVDVEELLLTGPQLREYSLHTKGRVLASGLTLRAQNFEDYDTLPGQYRAAGYYPDAKLLIGGKIKGSVVVQNEDPIGLELPEAHRIGLEFGRHEWFLQVGQQGQETTTTWADLVCPYCGGPTWRDPDGEGFVRGFCMQCAVRFGVGEAMDGRTHFASPTVAASPSPPTIPPGGEAGTADGGYKLRTLVVERTGGSEACEFGFHWRPDLYDETEAYLTQSGAGQATNAPRWFARHVDQVGDGLGFGVFDSAASPPFSAGHALGYFGALPEVGRNLGLAQMKLVFPDGYGQAETAMVELDCVRADGATETVRVVVATGTRGAGEGRVSDAVPLVTVDKVVAESSEAPHAGCGFFKAVSGARLISGAECRFTVVNDTPLLSGTTGVWVEEGKAALVALQTGERPGHGGPHLMDDAVGQVFLFYAKDGQVWMKRRRGLPVAWEEPRQITETGDNRHPCAEKDERGRLQLMWQRGGDMASMVSVDDGEQWVEV